jgi:hypothetical protein
MLSRLRADTLNQLHTDQASTPAQALDISRPVIAFGNGSAKNLPRAVCS